MSFVPELLNTARSSATSLIFDSLIDGRNLITISVRNQDLKQFSGLTISYEIDTPVPSFSFTVPFNPDNSDLRELFKPFAERKIEIKYGYDTILTGRIDKITPSISESGNAVNIQGRGLLGDTIDSDVINQFYFRNITLQNFANILLGSGAAIFEPDSVRIPVIQIDKGEKIYEALTKEAGSKGYWAIPTLVTNCIFTKISSSDPIVAELEEGVAPVQNVESDFDRTKRFGQYFVIGSGNGVSKSSLVNDSEISESRTKLIKATKENSNYRELAQRTRSQDVIDSISLSATLTSWTINESLWQPGVMVQLIAPNAMIYKPSKFVVRKVELKIDESGGESCILDFALPNAFDNSEITELPWELPQGQVTKGLGQIIRDGLGI